MAAALTSSNGRRESMTEETWVKVRPQGEEFLIQV